MIRRALVTAAALGVLAGVLAAPAAAAPSENANCIGAANSSGQGEFASSLATTQDPPEFGQVTSETLGGGLIGAVASSNDCG